MTSPLSLSLSAAAPSQPTKCRSPQLILGVSFSGHRAAALPPATAVKRGQEMAGDENFLSAPDAAEKEREIFAHIGAQGEL